MSESIGRRELVFHNDRETHLLHDGVPAARVLFNLYGRLTRGDSDLWEVCSRCRSRTYANSLLIPASCNRFDIPAPVRVSRSPGSTRLILVA